MKKPWALALFVACGLGCSAAWGQNLYGEDLVRRLGSPGEIREASNIRARLQKVAKSADPLFVLTPLPFGEIDAAPNTQPVATGLPKQWYLPPWPSLDPALPDDMPEDIRKEYENRRKGSSDQPEVWPGLMPQDSEEDAPSVMLRPRNVAPGEEFAFRDKQIPKPFSLRRYYDSDPNVFLELASYGGTTSYKAEEAYRAMKEVAVKQEPILGIGEEAFLTRVVIIEEGSKPPEAPLIEGPAMPEAPPFADILPTDNARPELTDSSRAAALSAPAFNEVPVADLEGQRPLYPAAPKKYYAKGGKVKQSLLVLVAFFPDDAVTLTIAIEERLGTVQDLVAVAILAQRKLREDIRG